MSFAWSARPPSSSLSSTCFVIMGLSSHTYMLCIYARGMRKHDQDKFFCVLNAYMKIWHRCTANISQNILEKVCLRTITHRFMGKNISKYGWTMVCEYTDLRRCESVWVLKFEKKFCKFQCIRLKRRNMHMHSHILCDINKLHKVYLTCIHGDSCTSR